MAYKLHLRLADTDGDGSGTKNAIGNYAGSPTVFKVQAQSGEHIIIQRLIMGMTGDSFANADEYGSGPALTVGIHLYVTDNRGVIQYYLTDEDHPVKSNGHWAHMCYDYTRFNTAFPNGDEYAAVRWTFGKSGKPVELLPGWSLNILLQDDFRTVTTGLKENHFNLQGHYLQPRIGSDAGHD